MRRSNKMIQQWKLGDLKIWKTIIRHYTKLLSSPQAKSHNAWLTTETCRTKTADTDDVIGSPNTKTINSVGFSKPPVFLPFNFARDSNQKDESVFRKK